MSRLPLLADASARDPTGEASSACWWSARASTAISARRHSTSAAFRCQPSSGYFHPNVVCVLVEPPLVVLVSSANLTRAGWWENVEAAAIEELRGDELSRVRDDLAGSPTTGGRARPTCGSMRRSTLFGRSCRRMPAMLDVCRTHDLSPSYAHAAIVWRPRDSAGEPRFGLSDGHPLGDPKAASDEPHAADRRA